MRTTALALIVSLLMLPSLAAAHQEGADWHTVAAAIPLGSKVKVQNVEGDRYTGTLMRVDGTTLVVKKNTRRPESAVTIPFDRVARIERVKEGGFTVGKAIAVGAGAGAGAMLTLLLFLMQLD